MSNFIYNTSERIKDPWLIEKEALLDLDSVIENACELLTKSHQQFLDEEIQEDINSTIKIKEKYKSISKEDMEEIRNESDERVKERYSTIIKSISITFPQSKKLEVNSFSDALHDNSLID